jgi:hypothetical protein
MYIRVYIISTIRSNEQTTNKLDHVFFLDSLDFYSNKKKEEEEIGNNSLAQQKKIRIKKRHQSMLDHRAIETKKRKQPQQICM